MKRFAFWAGFDGPPDSGLSSCVMKKTLKGRKALVTGATAGIGLATVKALAAEGVSILAMGRRKERLENLKKQVEALGVACEIACVDVTKKNQVQGFLDQSASSLSSVDILVNNAGLARGSDSVQKGNLQDWDEMIDTNIKGLLWITRGVLPHMIPRQRGDIVNLGSVAGRWVYPGGAVYCSTKFAVRALSEGLRMDLFGTGLRVTNIEPGMVDTEFSTVRLGDPEKAKRIYEGMRALSAEDIAQSVVWALSCPPHVNIQELVIFPTDQYAIQMVDRKPKKEAL